MEKIVRSKVQLTYTHPENRKQHTSIVALQISGWNWNEQRERYEAVVRDYEQIENTAAQPGEPKFLYKPLKKDPVDRIRTTDQVNQLFQYFGVTIQPGDDYTAKQRDLYVKGLLYDTQVTPIYNSTADDWEIVDTSLEVVPQPEE